jgi:DNA-binding HxlR family transcriptional regulator
MSGQSSSHLDALPDDAILGEQGVADILRLLGAGASGAILMALGDGSLRTKELTQRVPGYAPRTVYRHIAKLVEFGAIERDEDRAVPSKVVHRLTDSSGTDLHHLVDAYATASLERFANGDVGGRSWGSLTLLAELWDSGIYGDLNGDSHTATELAGMSDRLTFHQISRLTNLFAIGGFISEVSDGGRRQHYQLTSQARRGMALIAGLGRWREDHVVAVGESGLTMLETAEVLRTVLPLLILPDHGGKSFELSVKAPDHISEEGKAVWAEVKLDEGVIGVAGPLAQLDGWGGGGVQVWIDALVLGSTDGITIGGFDDPLVADCLRGLHTALWEKEKNRVGR